jgi:hypothetical protein
LTCFKMPEVSANILLNSKGKKFSDYQNFWLWGQAQAEETNSAYSLYLYGLAIIQMAWEWEIIEVTKWKYALIRKTKEA